MSRPNSSTSECLAEQAVLGPLRSPDATKVWFSQAEAAEYVGVHIKTVRRYIARGDLRASRVRGSGLIRIRREDLDALLSPIPSAKVGA